MVSQGGGGGMKVNCLGEKKSEGKCPGHKKKSERKSLGST